MAVADFGGTALGRPIEVTTGDMLLKPDIAAQIAAKWYDVDGVDVIVDLPLTSAALAVLQVARARTKATIISSAAAADFTGPACSATNIHWTDDTFALANTTGRAVVAAGGKTWFFLTADYAFGAAMQKDADAAITAAGGRVVGSARHPMGSTDFSSLLLQARASGAAVVGLASVGGDTITAIKQAAEFGLAQAGLRLAGLLVFITDIHAIGLESAQGLYVSSGFYWDQNDAARQFSQRFFAERKVMPTKAQAGAYSSTLHWLRAVQATGGTDAVAVNAQMRATPGDFFGKPVRIRPDGRALYDMTLYRVKSPGESLRAWDYYKPIQTIPADQAFRPVAGGGCLLPS
jgi:branched-chain amino acid transport system substrate-binding protein